MQEPLNTHLQTRKTRKTNEAPIFPLYLFINLDNIKFPFLAKHKAWPEGSNNCGMKWPHDFDLFSD